MDLQAIRVNYGKTHDVPTALNDVDGGIIDADLYIDTTGLIFPASANITVPIKLGTAADPMTKIYGLATSMEITGILPVSTPSVNPFMGWIGNSTNSINFNQPVNNTKFDWAFARTDHRNNMGDGMIGSIEFKIPISVPDSTILELKIDSAKTRIIDSAGRVIRIRSIRGAKVYVRNFISVEGLVKNIEDAIVLPNPSKTEAMLRFYLNKAVMYEVAVYDIVGKKVWQHRTNGTAGIQQIQLPAQSLNSGMHIIKLSTDTREVQAIKWLKQ
jgi:hypothetical protein